MDAAKIEESIVLKIELVGTALPKVQSFFILVCLGINPICQKPVRRWDKCNVRAYNKGVQLITPQSTKRMYEEAKRVGNLAYQG